MPEPLDRTPAHLADMLQFVCELRSMVQGLPLSTYQQDRIRNLAVERLFINLGEAAVRLDPAARDQLPEVPWRQIIGLRNILAHGYEQIAHETLHRTILEDLPALEAALARALPPNP